MEASSSSNRTESAAEFVATVRKDHNVMMDWYNNNNNNKLELQQLHEKYGPRYPESWKHVLNWNGWKDTRKVYLQHLQQQKPESSTTTTTTSLVNATPESTNEVHTSGTNPNNESIIPSSSTAAITTATEKEESKNDTTTTTTTKPKRKSRWGSVATTTPTGDTTTATTASINNTNGSTTNGTSVTSIITNPNDTANSTKRGRWGMTTTEPTNMTTTSLSELEQLRMQLRTLNYKIDHVVEEANRIDALPHDHRERSVSPPPIYGPDGKRQNTRAVRYKERYTTERQDLLEKILELTNQQSGGGATTGSNGIAHLSGMNGLPGNHPMGGGLVGLLQYHKPTKKSEKIHIPVEKYPNYNFIGLIIGPRGKTQKELEAKTGCKIAIRGKGSVKEGARGRRDGSVDTADHEPLHVVVTGDDPRAVTAAATMIREMLVVIDDEKNVHKQQQLRELALLNGTLKDDNDGNSNAALYCPICAEKGHRAFECPKRFNATSGSQPAIAVKCAICGDTSHPTRDCKLSHTGSGGSTQPVPPPANEKNIDSEYQSFMAELDGKTITANNATPPTVSTLPLPPPPSGDSIVPPTLPPPPVLPLPPPTATTTMGDGSVPNPSSLPLPPLPPPPSLPLPGPPPTAVPLPPPPTASAQPPINAVPAVPYQYQLPPPPPIQQEQSYYLPGPYAPLPPPQQQYHHYHQNTTMAAPSGYPPPSSATGVPLPTATTTTTTMVQPGEETATWDPNAYYGANTNTSLNWWEQ